MQKIVLNIMHQYQCTDDKAQANQAPDNGNATGADIQQFIIATLQSVIESFRIYFLNMFKLISAHPNLSKKYTMNKEELIKIFSLYGQIVFALSGLINTFTFMTAGNFHQLSKDKSNTNLHIIQALTTTVRDFRRALIFLDLLLENLGYVIDNILNSSSIELDAHLIKTVISHVTEKHKKIVEKNNSFTEMLTTYFCYFIVLVAVAHVNEQLLKDTIAELKTEASAEENKDEKRKKNETVESMSFILNILSLTHKNEPAVVAPHAPENETKAAEVVETPTVKEAPKEEKSKKATKNKKK